MATAPPPPTVTPCGNCWIEIQLLDTRDEPVPDEPYWVRLPDGSVREGRLDKNGFVRLAPVPCGVAQVRFPRIHGPSVRQGASHPDGLEWIEIELLDAKQRGVGGEAYRVVLPDGRMLTGTLDPRGRARIERVPRGSCRVTFPDLDGRDVKRA